MQNFRLESLLLLKNAEAGLLSLTQLETDSQEGGDLLTFQEAQQGR